MVLRNFPAILLLIYFIGCDPVDNKLVFNNTSSDTIYYIKIPYNSLDTFYRKSTESQGKINYLNYLHKLRPNTAESIMRLGMKDKAWESYIKKQCEDSKLRIYTFSIDTLKKYSLKDVADHNRYIQKKEISVEDLEKSNWVVTFP